jgi:tetratricopeptide (TPR) repeat protein
MSYLKFKQEDIKRLTVEMNASVRPPDYSGLSRDIAELKETYFKDGFNAFHALAMDKVIYWKGKVDSFFMPSELYEAIADISFNAERYKIARYFYEEGLKKAPDDKSLLIGMGKIQALNGCFQEAEECFKRACKSSPNIYTAAKYAEIMFVNGRDKSDIREVTTPYLEEALTRRRVRFDHYVIIAANILNLPKNQRSEALVAIQRDNGFTRVDEVMNKITNTINYLTRLSNEGPALRKRLEQAPQDAKKEYPYQGHTKLAQSIMSAYLRASDIWHDPYVRAPASNQDARSAGGSARMTYKKS